MVPVCLAILGQRQYQDLASLSSQRTYFSPLAVRDLKRYLKGKKA